MKSIGRWLLFSTLGCFCAYALAESAEEVQAESEAEPEAEQVEPASAPAAESTERPKGAKADPEIFVPTEEISEDFAVSFPVDI